MRNVPIVQKPTVLTIYCATKHLTRIGCLIIFHKRSPLVWQWLSSRGYLVWTNPYVSTMAEYLIPCTMTYNVVFIWLNFTRLQEDLESNMSKETICLCIWSQWDWIFWLVFNYCMKIDQSLLMTLYCPEWKPPSYGGRLIYQSNGLCPSARQEKFTLLSLRIIKNHNSC